MNTLERSVIAAVPGGLVIHQNLDAAGAGGLLHGSCIFETDSQWLFHHDVYAMTGADFHHLAMVVRVGVGQHSFRMRLFEGILQVGKKELLLQSKTGSVLGSQFLIGLGDAHDMKIRTVLIVLEKSFGVSVHQAGYYNSQWRISLILCKCSRSR